MKAQEKPSRCLVVAVEDKGHGWRTRHVSPTSIYLFNNRFPCPKSPRQLALHSRKARARFYHSQALFSDVLSSEPSYIHQQAGGLCSGSAPISFDFTEEYLLIACCTSSGSDSTMHQPSTRCLTETRYHSRRYWMKTTFCKNARRRTRVLLTTFSE